MKTLNHFLVVVSALFFLPSVFAQGNLTPPGAPAPSMKSLDQIDSHISSAGDKRIDVLGLAGDGTSLHVISNSGSYYLSGNLTGSGAKSGIEIDADNVTLDLNGFTVDGTGSTAGVDGISIDGDNSTIYNGTIRSWSGNGINCFGNTYTMRNLNCLSNAANGILGNLDSPVNNGYIVSNCHCSRNGAWGILIYFGSAKIDGCVAIHNGAVDGSGGIYGGGLGGSVVNCVATDNLNTNVPAISSSVVTGCDAEVNSGDGIYGAVVTSSYAASNGGKGINGTTVANCTSSGNAGGGIVVGTACTVVNCSAVGNTGDGIQFVGRCLIKDNNASNNSKHGLHVTGTFTTAANRIDGNMATGNGLNGILWVNDLVVRNSCFLNTGANYSPAVGAGNTGPVQAASSSTNPFANF